MLWCYGSTATTLCWQHGDLVLGERFFNGPLMLERQFSFSTFLSLVHLYSSLRTFPLNLTAWSSEPCAQQPVGHHTDTMC